MRDENLPRHEEGEWFGDPEGGGRSETNEHILLGLPI
jgi:hypothetical protein